MDAVDGGALWADRILKAEGEGYVVATSECRAADVLVRNLASPTEAYWRYTEYLALRGETLRPPILEVGCGTGAISGLLAPSIDLAIDLNPRAVERAKQESVFRDVQVLDARELTGGRFQTALVNCVLEHIPAVEEVLAGVYRALAPGGRLVATVPLIEMDNHLVLKRRGYVLMRRRQLAHLNLWDASEWETRLVSAGFSSIRFTPYLSGRSIALWDPLDSLLSFGLGRYRVGPILNKSLNALVPRGLKEAYYRGASAAMVQLEARVNRDLSAPCAAMIVAEKPLRSVAGQSS